LGDGSQCRVENRNLEVLPVNQWHDALQESMAFSQPADTKRHSSAVRGGSAAAGSMLNTHWNRPYTVNTA